MRFSSPLQVLALCTSLAAVASCGPSDPVPSPEAPPVVAEQTGSPPPSREAVAPTIPTPSADSVPAAEPRSVQPDPRFRCVMPALPIPRPAECERRAPYPECKWKLPHALHSRHSWRRWRNTISAHQYGRPALVGLLVTTASELHRLAPDQPLLIGDLDAPGPRHSTHDHGVDADLYLPGTLMVENAGGGDYEDNYANLSPDEIEAKRATTLLLAQILATCSGGQIRIYYNDATVRERFLAWFEEHGYTSSFGAPMQAHNPLHDFHFHISVPEDLPLLPSEPYAEPPPVEPIEAPPTEEEVAASNALSSRSGHTTSDDAPDHESGSQNTPTSPGETPHVTPAPTPPSAPSPTPVPSPAPPMRSPSRTRVPTPMPRWPTQPAL